MKRWTTSIIVALSGLLPTLSFAQGWAPPGAPSSGWHDALSGPPGGFYEAGTMYDPALLPPREGPFYAHDSNAELALRETLSRGWLRFDYLLYDFKEANSGNVGAPVSGTFDLSGRDPLNRLPAVDPISGVRGTTFVSIPGLSQFSLDDNSGVRGTLGLPTNEGTLELDVWGIAKAKSTIALPPRIDSQLAGLPQSVIAAVPLLSNGSVNQTTMLLFSDSYRARLNTSLWGTGGDWVFKPFVPNQPLEISPILGFRYIQLQERQEIQGQDTDPTTLVTLNHSITSLARNDVFGPQIGLRFATTHGKVDFGFEPKILLGINRIKDGVNTDQIFSLLEAPRATEETNTQFTPVLDLSAHVRVQLSPRVAMYAGYDLLIGQGFSRAFDNIVYDSPILLTDAPTIRAKENHSDFYAHGLMIGGEVSFR